MRRQLDDNTRSALHYLLLGIALTIVLRLAWTSLYAMAYAGLSDLERPFRWGYLGLGPSAVVVASTGPVERLFTALLVAVAVAAMAALAWACTAATGRAKRFGRMFRLTALLLLPVAVWAALFAPPKSTRFTRDAVFLEYHRTFIADLPIPFSGARQGLGRGEVKDITWRQGAPVRGQAGYVAEILLRTAHGEEVIATAATDGRPDAMEKAAVDSLCARMVSEIRARFTIGTRPSSMP
jgi:hypothetical protein